VSTTKELKDNLHYQMITYEFYKSGTDLYALAIQCKDVELAKEINAVLDKTLKWMGFMDIKEN